MYTIIENHTYYQVTTDSLAKYHDLISKLSDKLPHGSGIDYDWFIHAYQHSNKVYLNASNSFHAMDEFGGYCHIYDFAAKYLYNPVTDKPCEYCNAMGYRLISEIHKYHPNMSKDDLIAWLKHTFNEKIINDHYFICNVCHGKKVVKIPEFELMPNRIIKNKELKCCGYSLDDYLSQALYLFSENGE